MPHLIRVIAKWPQSAAFSVAFCLLGLAGCSTSNPYFNAAKPHHRPGGFQNNYTEFEPKNFFTDVLLGWQLPSRLRGLPPAPTTPPPTSAPDLAFIRANAAAGAAMQPAITFIGHATLLAQIPGAGSGVNLLTDPVFSERVSPFSSSVRGGSSRRGWRSPTCRAWTWC